MWPRGYRHPHHKDYDSYYNSGESPEPTESPEDKSVSLRSYQVTYTDGNGKLTHIIEADEVLTGDVVEFWKNGILQFLCREDDIFTVYNTELFLGDK